MTTVIPFSPSRQAAFAFQPTLDGAAYNATVTWNLFGQRYYLDLYALDGSLVVSRALVGSPGGASVQSAAWAAGEVTLVTAAPHGYKAGQTVLLTVSGITPTGYNGLQECLVTGPSTLTYDLATDPGAATVLGAVTYDVSLVSGYFASTLVFRQSAMQFEVNP